MAKQKKQAEPTAQPVEKKIDTKEEALAVISQFLERDIAQALGFDPAATNDARRAFVKLQETKNQ